MLRSDVPSGTSPGVGPLCSGSNGWAGLGWADLIKGDLLVIPVLDVEEHHHPAILVSAGQDAGVAGFDGAAHGLGGQVVEELGVLLAEVHVAWREAEIGEDNGCSPGLRKPGQRWGSRQRQGRLAMVRRRS